MSRYPPSTEGGLLVLAPLRLEAWALRSGEPELTVMNTGAGARARLSTPAHAPGAIAVAGVGGGLAPGLSAGDLVVADRVLDESGETTLILPGATLLAAALARQGLSARVGPVISTTRLVRGQARRRELAATGALAVDLESATLCDQAAAWPAPVCVLRAVADTTGRELLSPNLVPDGYKALRALRAAAPVLAQWGRCARARTVLLAGPRSFCAGVERAIETVRRSVERFGAPVYVRRQIVHNAHVVADLERRGAVFVRELDEVPDGATVVFSAHGVAPSVREEAARRGLEVVDATCPLVAKVHTEARRFRDRGYQVVLLGHAGHDETEGTLGEVPGISLVQSPDDVASVVTEDPTRVAYITQTTLAADDVEATLSALRERFPAMVGPHASDICYATQNRQDGLKAIASECDVVLVVGSTNSSNANRLVEVAARSGVVAHLVEDERDLALEWIERADTIGLSAAASTPEYLVQRIVEAVGALGPVQLQARSLRSESVNFSLPPEVR